MKKTGILGGTFNPIHNAHLMLTEEAMRQFSLDQVLFMPAGAPPHKDKKDIVSAEHRCNMIKAAIADYKRFSLFDYEVKKKRLSYTAETMKELNTLFPKEHFYFIIGGDSIMNFESWRQPEEIVRYTSILACSRSGNDNQEIKKKVAQLSEKYQASFEYFDVPMMDISSHMIRYKLARNEDVSEYLPEGVLKYIQTHQLYQDMI